MNVLKRQIPQCTKMKRKYVKFVYDIGRISVTDGGILEKNHFEKNIISTTQAPSKNVTQELRTQ